MNDRAPDREMANVWSALRRRKVVQWGLVYVAAAWGFLQGLEYVSESFNWPQQVRQVALLALVIGLPIVLILAWYHGDRGQQRITTPEFAILTLLLLLGGGAFWYYQRTSEAEKDAAPPSPTAAATATDRSIAVLPFVNMSADKEQEYFADGISEELLNLLAQVPALRVIARTSSFSFKGKEMDIAEIARKLNVANVLEGSVRKSGDRLRITTQLIRTSDSSQLWAQTYERKLDDVFAVQEEIAAIVVEQLKIKLLGAAPTAPTTDPRAYALFLQARDIRRQTTGAAIDRSNALYQQALAIDPQYVGAWDGLASNYLAQVEFGLRPTEDGIRLARDAIEKALALKPDYGPLYARMSRIAVYDGDMPAAAMHATHALTLDPTDSDTLEVAQLVARRLGKLDQAIALSEYQIAGDPLNVTARENLGHAYRYAGRLDDAIDQFRIVLSLSPNYTSMHAFIAEVLLQKGDAAAALTEANAESSENWRLVEISMSQHALGNQVESDAALTTLIDKYEETTAFNIALVMAFRGDADGSFAWLEKAALYHDTGLSILAVYPLFASLHDDPRWLPFLRKQDMAPEQLAAIKFDVKVPD